MKKLILCLAAVCALSGCDDKSPSGKAGAAETSAAESKKKFLQLANDYISAQKATNAADKAAAEIKAERKRALAEARHTLSDEVEAENKADAAAAKSEAAAQRFMEFKGGDPEVKKAIAAWGESMVDATYDFEDPNKNFAYDQLVELDLKAIIARFK